MGSVAHFDDSASRGSPKPTVTAWTRSIASACNAATAAMSVGSSVGRSSGSQRLGPLYGRLSGAPTAGRSRPTSSDSLRSGRPVESATESSFVSQPRAVFGWTLVLCATATLALTSRGASKNSSSERCAASKTYSRPCPDTYNTPDVAHAWRSADAKASLVGPPRRQSRMSRTGKKSALEKSGATTAGAQPTFFASSKSPGSPRSPSTSTMPRTWPCSA
mmetsp:Transcript_11349/g.45977  ORF Transcript_11349/g.45977 Transcript_11349/m.45977 type:complete len:219 (+) Transcript_11349:855-1511(+)